MPSVITPVPPQFGHGFPTPSVPLAWQAGHTSSPLPGVPGEARSPGLNDGGLSLPLMPASLV
jgi:hypothetical protein